MTVDFRILALGFEKFIEAGLEGILHFLQVGEAGACFEEELAEPALPGADFFAGFRQPLMIDAEERLKHVEIDATEEAGQALVGDDRGVINGAEGVLSAAAADEGELCTVAVAKEADDAKLVVGVNEIIDRLLGKPKRR